MEPWDAIRIMRRQRPGSVERKTQEETVVMFHDILNEFGHLDNLEGKEREYKQLKRAQQALNDNLICTYSGLLQSPTTTTTTTTTTTPAAAGGGEGSKHKNKAQRQETMRRSRSMPKMNEEIVSFSCKNDFSPKEI
jgi:hypothetical protein